MEPIHAQVLEAACRVAGAGWTFRVTDVMAALPQLNTGTVRTHVSSRCCINAPANHQKRYRYFRAVDRGVYRIEPGYRQSRRSRRPESSQDRILSSFDSGVDRTLIADALGVTPTERLETMRRAARSLEAMRRS